MERRKFFSLTFILVFLLAGIGVMGQKSAPRDPMNPGTWLINFGVGPGINYYGGYSAGFGPGFQASFEKGIWQLGPGVLSLGGQTGLSIFSYGNEFYHEASYNYTWVSVVTAARSAYHYGWKVKGLDTYGGLSTGIRFLSFSHKYTGIYADQINDTYNPGVVSMFFGTFVGASYFFNNMLGVNAELGYNINYAQVGLVFKLN